MNKLVLGFGIFFVLVVILLFVWLLVLKTPGELSDWKKSGTCTAICDDGTTQKYTRTYTAPSWGGADAEDHDILEKTELCNTKKCKARGRYVKIKQNQYYGGWKCLQFAWIKVFSNGKNISKDKPFTQPDDESEKFPSTNLHLYDEGDPPLNGFSGNCKHKSYMKDGAEVPERWLELDLGQEYDIDNIELYNSVNTAKAAHTAHFIVGATIEILDDSKTVKWTDKFEERLDKYVFSGSKIHEIIN